MATFPERIKYLRNRKGLTQQDLANELSISRTAIAGYERLDKQPNFDGLIKIAHYFGVTTDFLLGISDKEFEQDSKADFYKKIDRLFENSDHFKDEAYGANEYLGFSKAMYTLIVKAYDNNLEFHITESICELLYVMLNLFDCIEKAKNEYKDIDISASGLNKRDLISNYLKANTTNLPSRAQDVIDELIDGCCEWIRTGEGRI